METTTTLRGLAGEAYEAFESATRDDGTTYTRRKDDAPEWISELCLAAHDDGEILPDDWRYECIEAACGYLANEAGGDPEDWAHEFADGYVDAYTAGLTAWLASSVRRLGYVDDAASEGLIEEGAGEWQRLAAGQYEEASEVFHAVRGFLEARADQDGDDE